MPRTISAILLLIATIGFVVAPFFTEPFMGYTREQLPAVIQDPPIQPEGYAFSIWGIIYIWLVISAVFGLLARRNNPAWDGYRAPLIASVGLGIFWLWIANQSAIWGTVGIVLMLITALIALLRTPVSDRWLARVPVALYAGWLSAASLVSLTVTFAGFRIWENWTGWAVVGMIAAGVLGCAIQRRVPNTPEYSVSIVWALIGIIVANMGSNTLVQGVAAIVAVMVAANAITQWRAA